MLDRFGGSPELADLDDSRLNNDLRATCVGYSCMLRGYSADDMD